VRFANDITLMSCQHNRFSPRSSLDNRGVCVSCGQRPSDDDTQTNIINLQMTCVLRIAPPVDVDHGVIYR
jgi:hypothetical protein